MLNLGAKLLAYPECQCSLSGSRWSGEKECTAGHLLLANHVDYETGSFSGFNLADEAGGKTRCFSTRLSNNNQTKIETENCRPNTEEDEKEEGEGTSSPRPLM